jgi:hypothetical protein
MAFKVDPKGSRYAFADAMANAGARLFAALRILKDADASDQVDDDDEGVIEMRRWLAYEAIEEVARAFDGISYEVEDEAVMDATRRKTEELGDQIEAALADATKRAALPAAEVR